MKIIGNKEYEKFAEKEELYMREHTDKGFHFMRQMEPKRIMPPHERRNMLQLEFDEEDWNVFKEAFGDEDTAEAAIEIIYSAPPEIQILAIQILNMIEEESI